MVTATGSKLWRFKYRFLNKEKLLSFGAYPEVSLAMARARRDKARLQLANNQDPSEIRRIEKLDELNAADNTLEIVAEKWFADNLGQWVKSYSDKIRLRLKNEVYPSIGHLPITSIKPKDILAILRRMQNRGVLESAHRVRRHIGEIFKYAVANDWVERDITADIRNAIPKPISKNFASINDPELLAKLLRDIDIYQGQANTIVALKLAPMLFCRPGELRGMRWDELNLEAAEWRIPPARQKIRKKNKQSNKTEDVIIPLPRQAVMLLKAHIPISGRSEFVFPSVRSNGRSMSDGTVNAALRTMGYGKDQITGHGFRHTASTMLNEEQKWSSDAIERQLSHKDNSIRGTYNNAKYLDERRRMIQSWANTLDNLKKPKAA